MKEERKEYDVGKEIHGVVRGNPVYCKTCVFSHGNTPFDSDYTKAHCQIFTDEEGEIKPKEVYFDGKECEYYVEE